MSPIEFDQCAQAILEEAEESLSSWETSDEETLLREWERDNESISDYDYPEQDAEFYQLDGLWEL